MPERANSNGISPQAGNPHQSRVQDGSTFFRIATSNPPHSAVIICLHKMDRIYRAHNVVSGHILVHVKDGEIFLLDD